MKKQPLDCKSSLGRELQPPSSLPGRSQTSLSPGDQTYLGVRDQREPPVQRSGQSPGLESSRDVQAQRESRLWQAQRKRWARLEKNTLRLSHTENGQGSVLKWSCKGGGKKEDGERQHARRPWAREHLPSFRSSRSPVWWETAGRDGFIWNYKAHLIAGSNLASCCSPGRTALLLFAVVRCIKVEKVRWLLWKAEKAYLEP